jgi:hypothetical protein
MARRPHRRCVNTLETRDGGRKRLRTRSYAAPAAINR